jgi:hypothetical protein
MQKKNMSNAILGRGSEIWNPQDLPTSGSWLQGGRELPIEFSRIWDHG